MIEKTRKKQLRSDPIRTGQSRIDLNISATRSRVAGEIEPQSAEHSATKDGKYEKHGPKNAIDLDLDTESKTQAETDSGSWLKITLDKIYCVKQVIEYKSDGTFERNWNCTDSDCSNCEGHHCSHYTMTVSTEGSASDLSPVSDCRYGDTVKLEKVDNHELHVHEIAIIGKGKPNDFYWL